jgi:2-oxoglutarate/2-oxoacid ferredoxin oxidoreductase subunit alpha
MTIRNDLSIVVSGEAGQGIQSIESMLTAFAKKADYHVFATKEYMSRVRGGCNSTEIRISSRPVNASVDRIDVLIPLIPEAIDHLSGRIGRETMVMGDAKSVAYPGMADVPFQEIAREAGGTLYANSVAVGAISALLKIDRKDCESSVMEYFSKKETAVREANVKAFIGGYERGAALSSGIDIDIRPDPSVSGKIMINGADSIALGAIAGGCDYVSAYPMSPGTTVLTAMAEYSKSFDIIVEQVEDEIGVANMAIGAWYAGGRALVTTSGGGFALMGEAVSLSGAIETPLVVHIAQRPGPATGLPTRTEQGDLDLAMHAGHGDFLRVVLAPGDPEEAFSLARKAFDIADRYQSPVFILTDQYFVDSYFTSAPFAVPEEALSNSVIRTAPDYRRYALGSPDGVSPRGIPGFGDGIVCVDSDEHDEAGRITEDKAMRGAMVAKRLAKISAVEKDILPPRLFGAPRYDTLLLGWGSTKGAILEAMERLGRPGLAFLHFPWLYPLPPNAREHLAAAESLVSIEGNATGQFSGLLQAETGIKIENRILKCDGAQFSVEELVDRISAFV